MRALLAVFLLCPVLAWAQGNVATPEEQLENMPPALQHQAHDLWNRLKCVVCSGQSIAQSQAPLAQDIRQRVLQSLEAGQMPEQIEAELAQRYGDAVLLAPPKDASTTLLWLMPLVLLLGGMLIIGRQVSAGKKS